MDRLSGTEGKDTERVSPGVPGEGEGKEGGDGGMGGWGEETDEMDERRITPDVSILPQAGATV